jgi:hypothetical protein
MKLLASSLLISVAMASLTLLAGADSLLVRWDFESIAPGTTSEMEASHVALGLVTSLLTEQGGVNRIGVANRKFGRVKVEGSADFDGSFYSVGMDTTDSTQSESSYSLNFAITPEAGKSIDLRALIFDLGYETNYATSRSNYHEPVARVFLSTNAVNWVPVGGLISLGVKDPGAFSTGPGSGGAHFIRRNLGVDLRGVLTTDFTEGIRLFVRIVLGEEKPSTSDRRRIILDNITLFGRVGGITVRDQGVAFALPEIQHVIVHHEAGRFSGWPANGGIWSWGDEILVGFEQYAFDPKPSGRHYIKGDSLGMQYARSKDGGLSWVWEAKAPIVEPAAEYDFKGPDFAMRLWRNNLFLSDDRGATWAGPVELPRFNGADNYARTNYATTGKDSALLFLSTRASEGMRARSFVARINSAGPTVEFLSWVGTDLFEHAHVPPDPTAYNHSIMPSGLQISGEHFICAVRQRIANDRWTDLYESRDGGMTWEFASELERRSDNPVALVSLGGNSVAAIYGWRIRPYGLRAKISHDAGRSWSEDIVLRADSLNNDLGYTRAVVREDGAVVIVYYHATQKHPEQHIAATIWRPLMRDQE